MLVFVATAYFTTNHRTSKQPYKLSYLEIELKISLSLSWFIHTLCFYSRYHIFFSFNSRGKKYFWHEWCKLASACRCLMLKKLKDTYMRGRENLISWYPYINVWIIWILLTHPFYSSQKAWNYIRYKNKMVIFRSEHCHIFTFPFVFSPFDYWIMYIVLLHV